jgi:hypothetical protein
MNEEMIHNEIVHALELLELTLPTTQEDLERARRVQLYNWDPARYANLTNNPKQYMKNYKQAEEMTKKIEAAYSLLSAVLVPDESDNGSSNPQAG